MFNYIFCGLCFLVKPAHKLCMQCTKLPLFLVVFIGAATAVFFSNPEYRAGFTWFNRGPNLAMPHLLKCYLLYLFLSRAFHVFTWAQ